MPKFCTAIAAITALLWLSGSAHARDGRIYVAAEAGAPNSRDIDWTVAGRKKAQFTDWHTGQTDVGLLAGKDFGWFRAEGEVIYMRSRVHDHVLNEPSRLAGPGLTPAGDYSGARGKLQTASAMLNVLVEAGGNRRLGLYGGLGVGVTRAWAHSFRVASTQRFLHDGDTVISWQAIAGARLPLGKHFELGLKLRHHRADNVGLRAIQSNESYKGNFRAHSALGTLAYNF